MSSCTIPRLYDFMRALRLNGAQWRHFFEGRDWRLERENLDRNMQDLNLISFPPRVKSLALPHVESRQPPYPEAHPKYLILYRRILVT